LTPRCRPEQSSGPGYGLFGFNKLSLAVNHIFTLDLLIDSSAS